MNINSDVLVSAIQKVMTNFEDRSSDSLSLQDIADKTNSSYTTIREIKKGILKNLSIKKALEISVRLGGPSSLSELVTIAKPETKEEALEFSKKFSHLYELNIIPKELEELLSDRDYARIIWAAFGSNHITRAEVKHRWGTEAEERVDFLIQNGYLSEEDGLLIGIADSASFGLESAFKQLSLAVPMYKIDHSVNQENWVSFQTNSVNSRFIAEFREKMRFLFQEFYDKSDSYEFRGDKRMFFGMIFDRYIEDLNSSSEVLQ